ncbi:hypothetical protein H5410_051046, partial [Solanum commersonii]
INLEKNEENFRTYRDVSNMCELAPPYWDDTPSINQEQRLSAVLIRVAIAVITLECLGVVGVEFPLFPCFVWCDYYPDLHVCIRVSLDISLAAPVLWPEVDLELDICLLMYFLY